MNKVRLSDFRTGHIGGHWEERQYLVPRGHTLDDLLDPGYFAQASVNSMARIHFCDKTHSIAGTLLVTGKSDEGLHVKLVSGGELDNPYEGSFTSGIYIVDFSPSTRFRVLSGRTKDVLAKDIESKDAAIAWINSRAA